MLISREDATDDQRDGSLSLKEGRPQGERSETQGGWTHDKQGSASLSKEADHDLVDAFLLEADTPHLSAMLQEHREQIRSASASTSRFTTLATTGHRHRDGAGAETRCRGRAPPSLKQRPTLSLSSSRLPRATTTTRWPRARSRGVGDDDDEANKGPSTALALGSRSPSHLSFGSVLADTTTPLDHNTDTNSSWRSTMRITPFTSTSPFTSNIVTAPQTVREGSWNLASDMWEETNTGVQVLRDPPTPTVTSSTTNALHCTGTPPYSTARVGELAPEAVFPSHLDGAVTTGLPSQKKPSDNNIKKNNRKDLSASHLTKVEPNTWGRQEKEAPWMCECSRCCLFRSDPPPEERPDERSNPASATVTRKEGHAGVADATWETNPFGFAASPAYHARLLREAQATLQLPQEQHEPLPEDTKKPFKRAFSWRAVAAALTHRNMAPALRDAVEARIKAAKKLKKKEREKQRQQQQQQEQEGQGIPKQPLEETEQKPSPRSPLLLTGSDTAAATATAAAASVLYKRYPVSRSPTPPLHCYSSTPGWRTQSQETNDATDGAEDDGTTRGGRGTLSLAPPSRRKRQRRGTAQPGAEAAPPTARKGETSATAAGETIPPTAGVYSYASPPTAALFPESVRAEEKRAAAGDPSRGNPKKLEEEEEEAPEVDSRRALSPPLVSSQAAASSFPAHLFPSVTLAVPSHRPTSVGSRAPPCTSLNGDGLGGDTCHTDTSEMRQEGGSAVNSRVNNSTNDDLGDDDDIVDRFLLQATSQLSLLDLMKHTRGRLVGPAPQGVLPQSSSHLHDSGSGTPHRDAQSQSRSPAPLTSLYRLTATQRHTQNKEGRSDALSPTGAASLQLLGEERAWEDNGGPQNAGSCAGPLHLPQALPPPPSQEQHQEGLAEEKEDLKWIPEGNAQEESIASRHPTRPTSIAPAAPIATIENPLGPQDPPTAPSISQRRRRTPVLFHTTLPSPARQADAVEEETAQRVTPASAAPGTREALDHPPLTPAPTNLQTQSISPLSATSLSVVRLPEGVASQGQKQGGRRRTIFRLSPTPEPSVLAPLVPDPAGTTAAEPPSSSSQLPSHSTMALPTAATATSSPSLTSIAPPAARTPQEAQPPSTECSAPRRMYVVPSPEQFVSLEKRANHTHSKSAAVDIADGRMTHAEVEERLKSIQWKLLVDYRERYGGGRRGAGGVGAAPLSSDGAGYSNHDEADEQPMESRTVRGQRVEGIVGAAPSACAASTTERHHGGRSGCRSGPVGSASHQHFIRLLRKEGLPCVSVALPSGDVMWTVSRGKNQHISRDTAPESSGADRSVSSCSPPLPAAPSSPEGEEEEHLLSVVVERKTLDDLEASVKSARYIQQRHAMSTFPGFSLIIWVVEGVLEPSSNAGTAGAHNGSKANFWARRHRLLAGRGGGWRSRRPPPTAAAADPHGVGARHAAGEDEGSRAPPQGPEDAVDGQEAAIGGAPGREEEEGAPWAQRLYSACASLSLHSKFAVLRTRNVQETAALLRVLSDHLLRLLILSDEQNDKEGCPTGIRAANTLLETTTNGNDPTIGDRLPLSGRKRGRSEGCSSSPPSSLVLPATVAETFAALSQHQLRLRATTAFPRLLQCFPGCSSTLALTIAQRFGSLYYLWVALHPPEVARKMMMMAAGGAAAESRWADRSRGAPGHGGENEDYTEVGGADSHLLLCHRPPQEEETEGRREMIARMCGVEKWERECLTTAQQKVFFMLREFLMTWSYT